MLRYPQRGGNNDVGGKESPGQGGDVRSFALMVRARHREHRRREPGSSDLYLTTESVKQLGRKIPSIGKNGGPRNSVARRRGSFRRKPNQRMRLNTSRGGWHHFGSMPECLG